MRIIVVILSMFFWMPITGLAKGKDKNKITVTEDTYIEAGESADINFGDKGDLQLKNSGSLNKYNREVYFKFKLKKVPEVKTAVLYVYGRAFPKAGKEGRTVAVDVTAVDNNWSAGEITWNTANREGNSVGKVEFEQADKPEWYGIILDPQTVEKAKLDGYLSLRLQHTTNSGLGAAIFAQDKTWSDGTFAGKEPYLLINGELPVQKKSHQAAKPGASAVQNSGVPQKEFKLLVGADAMVQEGKANEVLTGQDMLVKGSDDMASNSEVFLHFRTSIIEDEIVKATLNIPVKAPEGKIKLTLYDAKGQTIYDDKTNWSNRPNSGSFVGEFEVEQTDSYGFSQIDITKYVKLAHVIIDRNTTLRIVDYSKTGLPAYIASKEGGGYRSFLRL